MPWGCMGTPCECGIPIMGIPACGMLHIWVP